MTSILFFVGLYLLCHLYAVANHLSESPLAKSLLKEKQRWLKIHNQESCRDKNRVVIWLTYHKATDEIAALIAGDKHLKGARVAGNNISSVCDFDVGKYTSVLGPDSHYQTLMSEHSFLIVMGLLIEDFYPDKAFVGTCSWKSSRKGRPIPCQRFRTYNSSKFESVGGLAAVYWGPKAGPLISLDAMQRNVAKLQPNNENQMGLIINKFFREVFHTDEGMDPSGWAIVPPSGPALLWSNYFMTSPKVWAILAKFDFVVASWLDVTYPSISLSNLTCPSTYKHLGEIGHLSTHDVDNECRYCRSRVWTNWHRCRVGCHRCWSYVMEQLNVIFFSTLITRYYVNDDSVCGTGGLEMPPTAKAFSEKFSFHHIEKLYEDLIRNVPV